MNWFHSHILMADPLVILNDSSVTIPGCYKDVYANSVFLTQIDAIFAAECFHFISILSLKGMQSSWYTSTHTLMSWEALLKEPRFH